MEKQQHNMRPLVAIMFSFFAMGFVDLVGIGTNYVKADFQLSETVSSLLPTMVFFMFLFFSIPTGLLMNRIGQRKTVLISLVVTALGLLVPILNYSFVSMLASFALLGIGNALMQVSINPLLTNVVRVDRMASSLTFGQFMKAIAAFLGPIIAAWAALKFGNWRLLFPIFMGASILSILLLGTTKIREEGGKDAGSGFKECFSLLSDKLILVIFIAIICHVGIDVGTNVSAPKILMERLGLTLESAGFATSLYFIFRTLGCFSGSFLLTRISGKSFFLFSTLLMLAGFIGLFFGATQTFIYVCIAMIGFGNANLFPILFSQAMLLQPQKKNEVSGLLITALIGGAIFPLLMGVAADAMASQIGAIAVMVVGVVYLITVTFSLKR